MKILYILPGTGIAGGVITVFEHANRLLKRGHEVYISTLQSEQPQAPDWYPLSIPISPFRDISKLIREVDIVVSTLYTTAFYVHDLDCTAKKAYFVQHRESLFAVKEGVSIGNAEGHTNEEIDFLKEKMVKEYREVIEKSYSLPLNFLCVSTWLQDFLKKEYNQDAVLIPNGINKEIFYPEPIFARSSEKPIRVLIEASSLKAKWKGFEDALNVIKGIDGIEVWAMSSDNIDPNLPIDKYWKAPSQDIIRQLFSSSDILLKTSWYEGDGLPAKQAMTCGCAVLTTDQLGSRDFVKNLKNGLLAEPRNIEDIKDKLLLLIKDDVLRNKLIAGGFETAKSFEWESSIDILEETYARWTNTRINKEQGSGTSGIPENAGGGSIPTGIPNQHGISGRGSVERKESAVPIGEEPVVSGNEPVSF